MTITLKDINHAIVNDQRLSDLRVAFDETHLDVVVSAVNDVFDLKERAMSRQDIIDMLYSDVRNDFDISSARQLIEMVNSYHQPIEPRDQSLLKDQFRNEDARSFAISLVQRTLLQSMLTVVLIAAATKVVTPLIIVASLIVNGPLSYMIASNSSKYKPSTRAKRAQDMIDAEQGTIREEMQAEIKASVKNIFEKREPTANLPLAFKKLPEAKL